MQEMMRVHEAREGVRQQQQGHGNPIISLTDHGYRLVAVGNTLYWSKNWLVFPDFLLYFLKKTFGSEWGARGKLKGEHPIFRWLDKSSRYRSAAAGDNRIKTAAMMGFYACWLHLAYALYLIKHNDQLPKRLLKRLRGVTSFMPAYFEAIVGAALAVAGFKLTCAETKAGSTPTPEFRARSKTSGTTYEVEAKRKDGWKAPTDDPTNGEFERELESYLRAQIHRSSKKKLPNAIYCFELSIPTLTTESAWRTIATKIDAVIRESEKSMTVDGQPIGPAFVLVTNHTFLVNEDIMGNPFFGYSGTLKIDDYPFGRPMEIEAALAGYDKYRDVIWLADAWKIAHTVPTTFDGTPPELLSPNGEPQKTVQIGDMLLVPDEEGKQVTVRVEDIVSLGDKAVVAVHDPSSNKRWLAELPLTEAEAGAVAHFTDAVFGKINVGRRLRESDPFDLYDFFLSSYAILTQEQADNLFAESPVLQHYKGLPLAEARVRIAREYTKAMWAQTLQKQQGE